MSYQMTNKNDQILGFLNMSPITVCMCMCKSDKAHTHHIGTETRNMTVKQKMMGRPY